MTLRIHVYIYTSMSINSDIYILFSRCTELQRTVVQLQGSLEARLSSLSTIYGRSISFTSL